MIEIRTLHVGSGSLGYGPEVGGERFCIALLDSFIAFPQRFRDDASHRLSGGLSDCLGEPVGFRVFDVEAHGASFLLYHLSTFLDSSSFPTSGQGLGVILPAFDTRKVEAITRGDVARLHHDLADKPLAANRVLALISIMFNLAESWGLRVPASNPWRHLKRLIGLQERQCGLKANSRIYARTRSNPKK